MPKAMLPIITNQIKLDPSMKSLSIFNMGLNPNRSKKASMIMPGMASDFQKTKALDDTIRI